MNRYKAISIILLLILAAITTGCSKLTPQDNFIDLEKEESRKEFISASDFLLNTNITINLYDKQDESILKGCFELIAEYENIFSRTSQLSELYAVNQGAASKDKDGFVISEELADILQDALYFCKISDGAFDLTIEPVSSLWNFTAAAPLLPDPDDLTSALPLVGYKQLTLKDNHLTFAKEGMGIDLGAIAKGYIADKVKEYLHNHGVHSAMINLGGNIICVGLKPDNTPFHVGIQKPFADRNETVAILDINDLSVVSSGIYERYFESEGQLYHHILDPSTGYPYHNDLVSVTIISQKSTDGDGLSTSCFALGLEKGLKLIESLPDTYAVFITSDGNLHYSEGFQETIHITEQ